MKKIIEIIGLIFALVWVVNCSQVIKLSDYEAKVHENPNGLFKRSDRSTKLSISISFTAFGKNFCLNLKKNWLLLGKGLTSADLIRVAVPLQGSVQDTRSAGNGGCSSDFLASNSLTAENGENWARLILLSRANSPGGFVRGSFLHSGQMYEIFPAENDTAMAIQAVEPEPAEHGCGVQYHDIDRLSDINGSSSLNYFQKKSQMTFGCLQTRTIMEVGVAVDCSYVLAAGSKLAAEERILNTWNIASEIYLRQFNIVVEIVDLKVFDSCGGPAFNREVSDEYPLDSRLNDFSNWRGTINSDAPLWHLMSNGKQGSTIGLAWVDTFCMRYSRSDRSGKVVSGTAVSTFFQYEWNTVAHEIAHNLGAWHDCSNSICSSCGRNDCSDQRCTPCEDQCDCGGQYVMNPYVLYQVSGQKFSPRSEQLICKNFALWKGCLKEYEVDVETNSPNETFLELPEDVFSCSGIAENIDDTIVACNAWDKNGNSIAKLFHISDDSKIIETEEYSMLGRTTTVSCLAINEDGLLTIAGSFFVNISGNDPGYYIKAPNAEVMSGDSILITSCALSSDGRFLIAGQEGGIKKASWLGSYNVARNTISYNAKSSVSSSYLENNIIHSVISSPKSYQNGEVNAIAAGEQSGYALLYYFKDGDNVGFALAGYSLSGSTFFTTAVDWERKIVYAGGLIDSSNGKTNLLIAKFSLKKGNQISSESWINGTTGDDAIKSLLVDRDGTVWASGYVGGDFQGSVGRNGTDGFLMSLNSSLDILSFERINSNETSIVNFMAFSPRGNLFSIVVNGGRHYVSRKDMFRNNTELTSTTTKSATSTTESNPEVLTSTALSSISYVSDPPTTTPMPTSTLNSPTPAIEPTVLPDPNLENVDGGDQKSTYSGEFYEKVSLGTASLVIVWMILLAGLYIYRARSSTVAALTPTSVKRMSLKQVRISSDTNMDTFDDEGISSSQLSSVLSLEETE